MDTDEGRRAARRDGAPAGRRGVRHRRQMLAERLPGSAGRARRRRARGRLSCATPRACAATCRPCRPRPIGTSSRRSPDFVAMFVPGDGFLAAAARAPARPDDRGHGPAGDAGDADHPVRPLQGGGLWLAGGGAGRQRRRDRRPRPRALQAPVGDGRPRGGLGKALEPGGGAATTSSSARWRPRC